ncbi:unnamed protein product, partial [Polarella glacialis]
AKLEQELCRERGRVEQRPPGAEGLLALRAAEAFSFLAPPGRSSRGGRKGGPSATSYELRHLRRALQSLQKLLADSALQGESATFATDAAAASLFVLERVGPPSGSSSSSSALAARSTALRQLALSVLVCLASVAARQTRAAVPAPHPGALEATYLATSWLICQQQHALQFDWHGELGQRSEPCAQTGTWRKVWQAVAPAVAAAAAAVAADAAVVAVAVAVIVADADAQAAGPGQTTHDRWPPVATTSLRV